MQVNDYFVHLTSVARMFCRPLPKIPGDSGIFILRTASPGSAMQANGYNVPA
jgi:hypothetical protein